MMTQADPSPITLSVSPIHAGEEGEGPLESTDLFVQGPDISLLINICVGNTLTYSGNLSGKKQHGTIHPVTQADPPEMLEPAASVQIQAGNELDRLMEIVRSQVKPGSDFLHSLYDAKALLWRWFLKWYPEAANSSRHAAEITRLTQERDAAEQRYQELAQATSAQFITDHKGLVNLAICHREDSERVDAYEDAKDAAERRERTAFEDGWNATIEFDELEEAYTAYQAHAQTPTTEGD